MPRFIGCDPGKVTGLCAFTVDEDNIPKNIEHWQLDHIAVGRWFEQWKTINGVSIKDTVIAMESFIVTPGSLKKNFQAYSLETIGLVRYFVETSGLQMRMSAPSAHKSLVLDDVLKRAGLWFPNEGHACDAARVSMHVAVVDHKLLRQYLKEEE